MRHVKSFWDRYQEADAWGMEVAIDLHKCLLDHIQSAERIAKFVEILCARIGVKPFREPIIVHFGDDPRIEGFSLVQLIETSSITGHFANESRDAFLNVFSCQFFEPVVAINFAKEWFEAKSVESKVLFRGCHSD